MVLNFKKTKKTYYLQNKIVDQDFESSDSKLYSCTYVYNLVLTNC
jgi:hypothetical protein